MAGALAPNFVNRTMWTQDNRDVPRRLNSEGVDLVYADPPFNSNKNYEDPVGSKAAGAAFKAPGRSATSTLPRRTCSRRRDSGDVETENSDSTRRLGDDGSRLNIMTNAGSCATQPQPARAAVPPNVQDAFLGPRRAGTERALRGGNRLFVLCSANAFLYSRVLQKCGTRDALDPYANGTATRPGRNFAIRSRLRRRR